MENSLIKLLLVEGDARYGRHVQESLSAFTSSRFDLHFSSTLAEARNQLERQSFDAILLNLALPDSDGLSAFIELHRKVPLVPIVILTCCDSEAVALQAVRQGAQDYLVKSKVDGKILSRVIRYAIERKRIEIKLVEANSELRNANCQLARGEESLRNALAELSASHQKLKETQLQLIQAERLECVGMLAAGVAHEVKNPLQTILMGLAYLSRNLSAADEEVLSVLTDMRDAVKRADLIVRGLLDLSGAHPLEIKPENINEIVERSLSFVNYEVNRSRILVLRDLRPNLARVPMDHARIEQALINLFMNAIQAMPDGGTLTVRTAARIAENESACPNQDGAPTSFVQIDIEDTGNGIPDEKLSQVFQPFFTTKPSGAGTGLGLPVSKQIIDLHGGRISLIRAPRGGVRARILLKTEVEYSI
jgi:signal transduction histidine kinase